MVLGMRWSHVGSSLQRRGEELAATPTRYGAKRGTRQHQGARIIKAQRTVECIYANSGFGALAIDEHKCLGLACILLD